MIEKKTQSCALKTVFVNKCIGSSSVGQLLLQQLAVVMSMLTRMRKRDQTDGYRQPATVSNVHRPTSAGGGK